MSKWTVAALVAAAMFFVASDSSAGSWYKSCDSGRTTTALRPGEFACYQPASKTDDSVTLGVSACENFDVLYHLDINADATASSTTLQIRSCPNTTASTNSCWIVENLTLDGDPSTNTEAIYGAAALFIYADMQGDGTINDPQVTVICHGPNR